MWAYPAKYARNVTAVLNMEDVFTLNLMVFLWIYVKMIHFKVKHVWLEDKCVRLSRFKFKDKIRFVTCQINSQLDSKIIIPNRNPNWNKNFQHRSAIIKNSLPVKNRMFFWKGLFLHKNEWMDTRLDINVSY